MVSNKKKTHFLYNLAIWTVLEKVSYLIINVTLFIYFSYINIKTSKIKVSWATNI